jgi:RHS repeat-associated protein
VALGLLLVLPASRAAETVTYYLTDAQGSVIMTEDAQGTTTGEYDYRPYGAAQPGPAAPGPGYTGHVQDPDTGLVYMQQRYYDPDVGQFQSVDPIGPAPGNISNFNRYAYANNSPVMLVDPTGMHTASEGDNDPSCPVYHCDETGGVRTESQKRLSGKQIEGARKKGDKILSPYLSIYNPNDPNYHHYFIGPTPLCHIEEIGCIFNIVAGIVGKNSVPFVFWYSGPGIYKLPYGVNSDPVVNFRPEPGVWINETLEGHRYYPGRVGHALYEYDSIIWLYTEGAGVGPNPTDNLAKGQWIFGGMHIIVQGEVLKEQLESEGIFMNKY